MVNEAGHPTRYEREVLRHFGPEVLFPVAVNLSGLDWRLARTDASVQVLDGVWSQLIERFRTGDNYRRLGILHAIRQVAPMQPKRVYELCRWAVQHPRGDTRGPGILADARVIDAIPRLLEQVAEHEEWLCPAASLLYRLGRDSPSGEPLRALTGIVAYHPEVSASVQERALECLERWVEEPDWADHLQSPLVVARELLKKAALLVLPSDGDALPIGRYAHSPDETREVRRRVISLLGRLAMGPSPRGRLAAVDVLLEGLEPPSAYFGRRPGSAELEAWLPQDLTILTELAATASGADPLVRNRIRNQLAALESRFRLHPMIAARAREAAAAVAETPEMTLYQAWSGMSPALPKEGAARSSPAARYRRGRATIVRNALACLGVTTARADAVTEALEAVDAAFIAAGEEGRPNELLQALGKSVPDLGVEVAERLLGQGTGLAGRMGALLHGIRKRSRRRYGALLDLADAAGGNALRSVAAALRLAAHRDRWTVRETAFAVRLAAHPDPLVRGEILHAVAFGTIPAPVALSILAEAYVSPDHGLGGVFADAAEVVLERAAELVDEATAGALLRRLAGVPRFAETNSVTAFLASAAARWPHLIVDFVLSRLPLVRQASEAEDVEAEREERPRALFRAVPRREWSEVWAAIRRSDQYADALARLRDAAMAAEDEVRKEWVQVFSELAAMDQPTANCLLEVIEAGDASRIELLLPVLEELPSGFVFAMRSFVERALNAADAVDRSTGAGVRMALATSVRPRIASRLGEPPSLLVFQRDKAQECAASSPGGSNARFFYDSLVASAEQGIARNEARLLNFQHGEVV